MVFVPSRKAETEGDTDLRMAAADSAWDVMICSLKSVTGGVMAKKIKPKVPAVNPTTGKSKPTKKKSRGK